MSSCGLKDVSKVYSGTVAVKHADFEVRRGAVNVLVGENGAGKSTLMKIIAGVEQPTLGTDPARRRGGLVRIVGRRGARAASAWCSRSSTCSAICPSPRTSSPRARSPTGWARSTTGRRSDRAAEFLERLEAGIRPDMLVEDLRIGQQQLVEIAKAVSLERAHPDHGRADLGAERRRGRDPVQGDRRPQGARRRDRLHLASSRGADPHRRLHHRAARWPHHRPGAR